MIRSERLETQGLLLQFAVRLADSLGIGAVSTNWSTTAEESHHWASQILYANQRMSGEPTVGVFLHLRSATERLSVVLDAIQLHCRRGPIALFAIEVQEGLSSPAQLAQILEASRLPATFVGWMPPEDARSRRDCLLAVIEAAGPPAVTAPAGFRVVAIMRSFNEEDIISESIEHLASQGCEVILVDNWSTDRTLERAHNWMNRGLLGVEHFPPEGPIPYHPQVALLRQAERLAAEIDADWFIHIDADELRMSPWTGVSLRDALFRVENSGFNCIDHTVIEFHPTEHTAERSGMVSDQLSHFAFSIEPSHFLQRKAWRKQEERIELAASAGHDVTFPGRKVYPFNFLLRHYPVRSQEHGERKLYRERRDRLNPFEPKSWSVHYQTLQPGETFVVEPQRLERYEERHFNETYLVERLSGLGVYRHYWGSQPAPVPILHKEVRRLAWSQAELDAFPVRLPSLDPARPSLGTIRISWDSGDGAYAALFVARDGQPERPFHEGPTGSAEASWIVPGILYRFRLYSDSQRSALHAEMELNWSP